MCYNVQMMRLPDTDDKKSSEFDCIFVNKKMQIQPTLINVFYIYNRTAQIPLNHRIHQDYHKQFKFLNISLGVPM